MKKTIIWVENRMEYLTPQLELLRSSGYDVKVFTDPEVGLRALEERHRECDLIILDILMGEMEIDNVAPKNGRSGIVLYNIIRDKLHCDTPILFLTVIIDESVLSEIRTAEVRRGHRPYMEQKPVRPSDLLSAVTSIIGAVQKEKNDA